MMGLVLFVLIFLVDMLVVYDVIRLDISTAKKILVFILILLLPVIGISLYYLLRPRFNRLRKPFTTPYHFKHSASRGFLE